MSPEAGGGLEHTHYLGRRVSREAHRPVRLEPAGSGGEMWF